MVVFLLCVIVAILLFGPEMTIGLGLVCGTLLAIGWLIAANWHTATDITSMAFLALGAGFWVWLAFVVARRITAPLRRKIIPERATGVIALLRR